MYSSSCEKRTLILALRSGRLLAEVDTGTASASHVLMRSIGASMKKSWLTGAIGSHRSPEQLRDAAMSRYVHAHIHSEPAATYALHHSARYVMSRATDIMYRKIVQCRHVHVDVCSVAHVACTGIGMHTDPYRCCI